MPSADSDSSLLGGPDAGDAQADATGTLGAADRRRLLALARESIAHGLAHGRPCPVVLTDEAPPLREPRASFVTLELGGGLRGCIGHLESVAPLAEDVAENAFAAAFNDPRFPPLSADELPRLQLEISVLTPPEPIRFTTEAELLAAIEPGRDGLILSDGPRRGTFLPSVWAQLPRREDFLRHLKQKAGLSGDYWSDQIKVLRYHTESFGE
jgi:AmmeMemoRadiSam system protein A